MALAVVDASVLIAYLDPGDAHHDSAIRALAEDWDAVILPASAYAEALVHPYEQGAAAVEHVESLVAELPLRVQPIDRDIARSAANLRAQKRVPLPDAMVLATGEVLAADAVLTADARWSKASPRARVV